MKQLTSIFAACASALVFTAGCHRTDTPPVPTAAPPANTAAQATTTPPTPPVQDAPSTPTAPMPPPDVPKSEASAGPKPGQVNDHSSPAFKGGGKEVPK
jgi:hypothetical protein